MESSTNAQSDASRFDLSVGMESKVRLGVAVNSISTHLATFVLSFGDSHSSPLRHEFDSRFVINYVLKKLMFSR